MTIDDFYFDSMSLSDFEAEAEAIGQVHMFSAQKAQLLRQLAYRIRSVRWANNYAAKAEVLANKISAQANQLED